MNKRLRTLTFALGALAALAFAGCSGASTQVVERRAERGLRDHGHERELLWRCLVERLAREQWRGVERRQQ